MTSGNAGSLDFLELGCGCEISAFSPLEGKESLDFGQPSLGLFFGFSLDLGKYPMDAGRGEKNCRQFLKYFYLLIPQRKAKTTLDFSVGEGEVQIKKV